jgi:hypothetical protein
VRCIMAIPSKPNTCGYRRSILGIDQRAGEGREDRWERAKRKPSLDPGMQLGLFHLI